MKQPKSGSSKKESQKGKAGIEESRPNAGRYIRVEPGILKYKLATKSANNQSEWRYLVRVKKEGYVDSIGGFTHIDLARKALALLRQEAESTRLGVPHVKRRVGGNTFAEYAEKFLAWSASAPQKSFATQQTLLNHLLPEWGPLKLTAITRERIVDYMQREAVKGLVTRSTINRRVFAIRAVLSYAVSVGAIPFNPLRRGGLREKQKEDMDDRKTLLGTLKFREPKHRIVQLDRATEQKLMEAITEEWMKFVVRLALASGCRQGELLRLQWKDFDTSDGTLAIHETKNGEPRCVPLPDKMKVELLTRQAAPMHFIVTLDDGMTRPNRERLSVAFKRAATAIGRGELRFHDLRHVCATRMLEAGAQLNEIADQLGHSQEHVTARYAHSNLNRIKAILNRVSAGATSKPNTQEVKE